MATPTEPWPPSSPLAPLLLGCLDPDAPLDDDDDGVFDDGGGSGATRMGKIVSVADLVSVNVVRELLLPPPLEAGATPRESERSDTCI